jgi:hypothetical protein
MDGSSSRNIFAKRFYERMATSLDTVFFFLARLGTEKLHLLRD